MTEQNVSSVPLVTKAEKWRDSRTPGYRILVSERNGRPYTYTVFKASSGLWELFDARYSDLASAETRAAKDAAK